MGCDPFPPLFFVCFTLSGIFWFGWWVNQSVFDGSNNRAMKIIIIIIIKKERDESERWWVVCE